MKTFDDLFNRKAAKEQAREIKERQARRGKFNFWKPKNGTSVFRILPPGSDKLMSRGLMGKLLYKHFLWWNGKSQGIFTSGILTDPEVYPYCPIQDALDRVEDVVPEEHFKRLRAKPRAFFNVLLRRVYDEHENETDKELWGKVLICDAPSGLYEFVTQASENPQIGFFVHPHKGADVIVIRTGSGIDTDYQYQVAPGDWSAIIPGDIEATDKLCDKLTNLDEFTLLKEKTRKDQIVAASKILEWAQQFGKFDGNLGSTDVNLARLEGFSRQTAGDNVATEDSEEGGDEQPAAASVSEQGAQNPQTQTTAPVQEPEKRDAPPPQQSAPASPTTPTSSASASPGKGPPMGQSGLPVCYNQFKQKNPGITDTKNTVDEMCKSCNFKLPCMLDAK